MKNRVLNRTLVRTIMRITCLQFLLGMMSVGLTLAHDGEAQDILNRTITLTVKDLPLRQVLTRMEQQADVKFVYSSKAIGVARPVTVAIQEQRLSDALLRILTPLQITFRTVGGQIILNPAEPQSMQTDPLPLEMTQPQDRRITGTVRSGENNETLPGVSIIVKGTTLGTTTDAGGRYALTVPDNAGTLVFSYVGYDKQEVTLGSRSTIDVILNPSPANLQEVVVVGYGTQERREITGSVSSVSEKEIKAVPVVSLDQALQGRAAGVQVTQNSGAPGASITVRVRGIGTFRSTNSDPLYVVDGVPIVNDNGAPSIATYGGGAGTVQSNPLNGLNPADIESMEILKDASATAIYGSRGANGVVIITTKRGKAGKTKINFDAFYGSQQVPRKIDMLNARQFAEFANEAAANAGQTPVFSSQDVAGFGEGTNWQNQIFRTAPMQNYNLSMAGGDERTRFAITGNYFNQQGNVRGANLERFSFRVNLDRQVSRRVRIGNSLTLSRWVENIRPTDRPQDPIFSTAISSAFTFSPTLSVRNPNGTYTQNAGIRGMRNVENPAVLTDELLLNNVSFRLVGSLFADVDILPGLTFRTNVGGDFMYAKENNYWNRNTIRGGGATRGFGEIGRTDNEVWLWENTLTYNKLFGQKHSLTALVGQMVQESNTQRNRAEAQTFPAGDVTQNTSLWLAQTPLGGFGDVLQWGIISYLARVNYAYDDKYLLTATVRSDGSSRFGADNRFGTFPSVSAGWRISREKFMSGLKFIDDLKLRASYGVTGNQEAPIFDRFPLMDGALYSFNSQLDIGQYARSVRNNTFRWESNYQADVGLDLSMYGGRVSVMADYYVRNSRDLWVTADLPFTTGYANIPSLNSAAIRNSGFEFTLNTRNTTGAFKWNTSLNFSTLRNRIIDFGSATGTTLIEGERALFAGIGFGGTSAQILRNGSAFPSFFGWQTNGIYQNQAEIDGSPQRAGAAAGGVNGLFTGVAPGDFRVVDRNGNGIIDPNDRTLLGTPLPRFFGGLTNTFSYRGLELSVFLQFSTGNNVLNANRLFNENLNGSSNQTIAALDRWTPTNPSNTVARATNASRPFMDQVSDRVVENGSLLRGRNITLAYNFPKTLSERWKMSNLRLYGSVQNAFLLTRYSGYDPELTSFRVTNLTNFGIDFGGHPIPRVFLVGINAEF